MILERGYKMYKVTKEKLINKQRKEPAASKLGRCTTSMD
jgi:hypothetical protein